MNLYAGIGGNRRLWQNVEVTAVELNSEIAAIYQDFFPDDKMIIGDAHQYLLEHFAEYDFIWSSPPCQSHSKLGKIRALNNDIRTGSYLTKPRFPDMRLYEEIIFLQHFAKGFWVIENVQPYYEPLIKAQKAGRHLLWSNFNITRIKLPNVKIEKGVLADWYKVSGFDLSGYKLKTRKNTTLRNAVNPKLGLHVLKSALGDFI